MKKRPRPRSPRRSRTRLLRYRGSGSTRSGDSEPPARELSPDPTLNPACPRTITCGSYLARDPARVAPLRVAARITPFSFKEVAEPPAAEPTGPPLSIEPLAGARFR